MKNSTVSLLFSWLLYGQLLLVLVNPWYAQEDNCTKKSQDNTSATVKVLVQTVMINTDFSFGSRVSKRAHVTRTSLHSTNFQEQAEAGQKRVMSTKVRQLKFWPGLSWYVNAFYSALSPQKELANASFIYKSRLVMDVELIIAPWTIHGGKKTQIVVPGLIW